MTDDETNFRFFENSGKGMEYGGQFEVRSLKFEV